METEEFLHEKEVSICNPLLVWGETTNKPAVKYSQFFRQKSMSKRVCHQRQCQYVIRDTAGTNLQSLLAQTSSVDLLWHAIPV